MIKEFKEFIMRGNVLDLAVGVVIGGAFTAIVTSLVENLITPLIALFFSLFTHRTDGADGVKTMATKINGVPFEYGNVLSAIITFVITAFVLFIILKAVNKAKEVVTKPVEVEDLPEIEASELLLIEIRDLLAQQQADKTKL